MFVVIVRKFFLKVFMFVVEFNEMCRCVGYLGYGWLM